MAAVNWKEHLGKTNYSWGCSLQRNAAAAATTAAPAATVPRRKETAATGSCNEEAPGERLINLQSSSERRSNEQGILPVPADGSITMRQFAERGTLFDSCEEMGEDGVVDDIILLDSRDEKMTDMGSQLSDDKMREDGGSDLFGSEDMGDADSDIIYLERYPSLDEMEDDFSDEMEDDFFDEMEDAMCQPEEDEVSEQHHGFDENTGEDDGSAALKKIDEVFLCPEDLKVGLGTHKEYKKPSIVSWYDFPAMPHYRFMPLEPVLRFNIENRTDEEKSGGSDISGLLDDAVEVHVFQLLSTSSTQS